MIDIGANLSNNQFNNDLEKVIHTAVSHGLTHLILTSTDWNTYQINLKIIEKYNHLIPIHTTYGLHPHNASNSNDIFQKIHTELNNKHVYAIGEFGLDYFRMISTKKEQTHVMEQFLDVAKEHTHLSLFLHERNAFKDFYSLFKNSSVTNKSVVHCFTGSKEEAKQYLDIGCYIGITGWISDPRRNTDLVEAVKYIPLDKLMIETDSPYLTPYNMPNRTKRNEPSYLCYVAQSIADIKSLPLNVVIEETTKNSFEFFSLPFYNSI